MKYRKMFGPTIAGRYNKEIKGILPTLGNYGLKVEKTCIISESQMDAARKTVKKVLKKQAKIWLDMYAYISITAKPAEVRMGRGKGGHDYWAGVVRKGKVILQVQRLKKKLRTSLIKRALHLGGSKLPVKTSVVVYNI
jgi:large subunit ribosomal protein L16